MTATLTDKSYILAYWFATDGTNDWYMIVWKDTINDNWKGEYTFRYHENDDPFSGKDRKSAYSIRCLESKTEEQLVADLNLLFQEIKKRYNKFSEFFYVRGNAEKFIEIAELKPYLHLQKKPVAQNEEVD